MLPKAKFWCNFQFFLVQTKAGDQTDCLKHNAHPKVATRRVAIVFVRCGIKLDFPFLSFLRSICAESQLTVEGNVLFLKTIDCQHRRDPSPAWMEDAKSDLHQALSLTRMRADSSKSSLGWENVFLLWTLLVPFPESLSIRKSSIRQ